MSCALIDSIELRCQFKASRWWILIGGNAYFCDALNLGNLITDHSNREITTITGSHTGSNTNGNVKGVLIHLSNCFYFPTGLQNHFVNLEGISIWDSKLKEVRQEDLKDFQNLREIHLYGNDIQFLEQNLFANNPKLELISLQNNKIAHIHTNVFDNFVGKLSFLSLSGNVCQFGDADDTAKANQIIAKVQSGSCEDETKLPTTTTTPRRRTTTTTTIPRRRTTTTTSRTTPRTTTIPETPTTTPAPSVTSAQFDDLKKLFEELTKKMEDQILEIKNVTTTTQSQQCGTCAGDNFEARLKFLEKVMGVDPLDHNNLP
jgi:Leucine rich repeat